METISLTGIAKEKFELMAHQGAKSAADSLSKMINKDVQIQTLAVRSLPLEEVPHVIGSPEELVTTVIMQVSGEATGDIILIYPKQSALNVADFLAKRELGKTSQLSALDKSAIKESGNVIAGAFLSIISDQLSINMLESVPDIATDMLKATTDFVLTQFANRGVSEAVAFEIDFEMRTAAAAAAAEKITASFVLLLDLESAQKVIRALERTPDTQ
jgi:chemotaxis protein CheC